MKIILLAQLGTAPRYILVDSVWHSVLGQWLYCYLRAAPHRPTIQWQQNNRNIKPYNSPAPSVATAAATLLSQTQNATQAPHADRAPD